MLGRVSGTQAEIRTGSGLPYAGWINSSKLSALFKGIYRVVAKGLIRQHVDCAHKENVT